MKARKVIIVMIVLMSGTNIYAQLSLDSLLYKVETGNPSLEAAQNLLESRKLEARTGLTPSNPEVDFAYLWGSSAEVGNRTDFAVTQSFDFPTAYKTRSKLSKMNLVQAELEYKATYQGILLKAHQVWINQVYLNKLEFLLKERLSYAIKVSEGFTRRLETGEANQLQVNQAKMKVISLENEINLVNREFSKNNGEILNLTGDIVVIINDTVVPEPPPIIFDSLLIHYREGFINQMYLTEVAKKSQEVDVIFNQKLPKLKAGYYQESILDVKLRGITAGISIPLWENAHAVNTAKAKLAFAESDAERYWQIKQNELRQKVEQLNYLKEGVVAMENLLGSSDNIRLLRQAMETGEISLTQFFYESDFYFQNILNLLEFKKEMLLLEVDLRKVYY